jgi:hypothetical protein
MEISLWCRRGRGDKGKGRICGQCGPMSVTSRMSRYAHICVISRLAGYSRAIFGDRRVGRRDMFRET